MVEKNEDKQFYGTNSFKTALVQYCIDQKIPTIAKPSGETIASKRNSRIAILISVLQIIIVTIFLFVTLSVTPIAPNVNVYFLLEFVFTLFAVAMVINYILFHYSSTKEDKLVYYPISFYYCKSDPDDINIMDRTDSIIHRLDFPKHKVEKVTALSSTFDVGYIGSDWGIFIFLGLVAISLFLFVFYRSNITLGMYLLSILILFLSMVFNNMHIENRKTNVEIYRVRVSGEIGALYSVTVGKYRVSRRVFEKKIDQNSQYQTVVDRTYKNHYIYLADSVNWSFFGGLKNLILWHDKEMEEIIEQYRKQVSTA